MDRSIVVRLVPRGKIPGDMDRAYIDTVGKGFVVQSIVWEPSNNWYNAHNSLCGSPCIVGVPEGGRVRDKGVVRFFLCAGIPSSRVRWACANNAFVPSYTFTFRLATTVEDGWTA